MTTRRLKRLAIALVVVLFLWGLAEVLGGARSDELGGDFALPTLTSADVDTVMILSPTDTIVLVKRSATEWTVNGREAAPDAVTGLFDALATSTVAELVARSAASHERMGVNGASGRRLRLVRAARVVGELIVGQRGPGYQGAYVRNSGEDRVYLVRGELVSAAERGLDDWRDRRIADVEPDSVREIRVQRGRASYTLRATDGRWAFATGAPADSGEVRRMLGQYRALRAGGFPTPAQEDSVDFARPDRRVTLLGAAGPLVELAFDSIGYNWWARRADRETVYRVDNWRMEQLVPADSVLKATVN